MVEAKIFASLQCNIDFDFAPDDLFTMVQASLHQVKPYISQSGKQSDLVVSDPHSKWVEDLAYELLESVFFEHDLLCSNAEPLLAASLVLSALYILSHS